VDSIRNSPWIAGDAATHPEQLAVVFWVAVVGLLALCALAAWRAGVWTVRARRWVRAATHPDPSASGEVLVSGTVVSDDPSPVAAVETDVERVPPPPNAPRQDEWRQVAQRASSRVFELKLDDGRRVRVEPGSATAPVDAPEETVALGDGRKRRTRAIYPAQYAWVRGAVRHKIVPPDAAGYRTAPEHTAVVVPRDDGSMDLSPHPPGAPARRRARFYTRWTAAFAALFFVVNAGLLGPYRALATWGTPAEADVIRTRTYNTRMTARGTRKPYDMPHYVVVAQYRTPGGARYEFEEEVSPEAYCQATAGSLVPFVVVPAWPKIHRVGPGVYMTFGEFSLSWWATVVAAIVFGMTVLGSLDRTARQRAY
jgi:hypothetical protein